MKLLRNNKRGKIVNHLNLKGWKIALAATVARINKLGPF